jgi:N-acetylneuraminate synthase
MKNRKVKIDNISVGDGEPVFIIAEIGINHNGSVDLAKKLIAGAVAAGVDCVKFQKRTPELCVPKDQWHLERDTPWGRMTYIDYKKKIEFGIDEYNEIDKFCKSHKIMWTASVWDNESVDFLENFDVPFYKLPSASLTDYGLINRTRSTGKPIMLSTGMSTMDEITHSISNAGTQNLLVAHSTSTYPCRVDELNLKMVETLRIIYPEIPIGYSGHETGLSPTWAAVTLGANFIERHITLDRAMWGTDQAASVEVGGFIRLVSNIRDIEKAVGDGVKRVYDSEVSSRNRLRKFVVV